MSSKWAVRMAFFVALVGTPVVSTAQDGITQKQAEKAQARKAKEKKKEKAKAEKELKARHMDIQDKATRKRLKKHNKRADKGGSGQHRDPFFQRIFGTQH